MAKIMLEVGDRVAINPEYSGDKKLIGKTGEIKVYFDDVLHILLDGEDKVRAFPVWTATLIEAKKYG